MLRASKQICRSIPGKGRAVQPLRRCSQAAKPESSAPPPPPQPSPKGGGVLGKLVGVTVLGVAGVTAAAWYQPTVRSTIEENVPYSKEAFDYVFQYIPDKQKPPPAVKKPKAILSDDSEQRSLLRKKELPSVPTEVSKPAAVEEPQKLVISEKEAKKAAEKKRQEEKKLKEEEEKRAKEEKKREEKERVERAIREKEEEMAADNAALDVVLRQGLTQTEQAVRAAIEASKSALEATRSYTQSMRTAMDTDTKTEESAGNWEAATSASESRQQSTESWEEQHHTALAELEKFKTALAEGKANPNTKKNATIYNSQKTMKTLSSELNKAQDQLKRAQSEARVMSEYGDLVKKGREQFRKELDAILPDVKADKRSGGKMTEAELNSLIAHAHRRLDQLTRQLADQQAGERLRVEAALEKQREEDEDNAKTMLARERSHWDEDLQLIKQTWDTEARVIFESELRQQLARQAAAHSDHLAQVLHVQEQELGTKHQESLGEALLKERDSFQTEVAGWVSRLKGIEAAVDGRADLEKQGRKAQELWLACQSLITTISKGETDLDCEKSKPLSAEISAIRDAGNQHPIVNTIVESIPSEAVEEGVWTQEALIDRFEKVHRLCRRTAMIDETTASMFRYVLSYFQSLLTFRNSRIIKENEEVDLAKLDTFMLVDNARHYLELGNLVQALRLMNQLQGEPRRVAQDWVKDARLLLEARQAADALLAHASARGLGSLF